MRKRFYILVAWVLLHLYPLQLQAQVSSWSTVKKTVAVAKPTAATPKAVASRLKAVLVANALTLEMLNLSKQRAAIALTQEFEKIMAPYYGQTLQAASGPSILANLNQALSSPLVRDRIGFYKRDKALLDSELDKAWGKINPPAGAGALDLTQIFRLISLTLQNNLESELGGPHFRASLLGLPQECRDYTLAKQSFYYGLKGSLLDKNGPLTREAMADIARQLACLSGTDLEVFEKALVASVENILERLEDRGLAILKKDALWATLPILLLTADVAKGWGQRSEVMRLFQEHRTLFENAVREKGWSQERVYLYSRISGALVGFPYQCQGAQPNCVDLLALIRSLNDPRALGFGDCALAGMIAQGLQGLPVAPAPGKLSASGISPQTQNLYTCPSLLCSTTPKVPVNNSRLGRSSLESNLGGASGNSTLQANWPNLTPTDLNQMAGDTLCRGPGEVSLQGPDTTGDCFPLFGEEEENPHDKYVECLAEGLDDTGTDASELFSGMPTGNDCRPRGAEGLMNPGAGVGGAGMELIVETSRYKLFVEGSKVSQAWKELKVLDTIAQNTVRVSPAAAAQTGTGAAAQTGTGAAARVAAFIPAILAGIILGIILVIATEGEIAEDEPPPDTAKKDETPPADEPPPESQPSGGGATDCAGDEMCGCNSCTATACQVLKHQEECTSQFMDEILTAIGRGKPEITKEKVKVDPRVAYIDPDAPDYSATTDFAGDCSPMGTGTQGKSPGSVQCGLMHCVEGSLTMLGGECACSGTVTGQIPGNNECGYTARCADGNPRQNQNGQCVCSDGEQGQPTPGGIRPLPVGPSKMGITSIAAGATVAKTPLIGKANPSLEGNSLEKIK